MFQTKPDGAIKNIVLNLHAEKNILDNFLLENCFYLSFSYHRFNFLNQREKRIFLR